MPLLSQDPGGRGTDPPNSQVSHLHVIETVWGEGVIRLVSQGGTVLGHAVVGLRHIDDRFFVKREGVPVQGPVPAVNLPETRQRASGRTFLPEAQRTSETGTHGLSATNRERAPGLLRC